MKFILLEYHEDGWCIEGYLLGKLACVKMFLFCLCTWCILWLGIEFCAKIVTYLILIHFPRIFQCQWLMLRILIPFWFQIIFREFMFVPLYLEAFRILFIILRFLKSYGDVLWQRSIFFFLTIMLSRFFQPESSYFSLQRHFLVFLMYFLPHHFLGLVFLILLEFLDWFIFLSFYGPFICLFYFF